MWRTFSEALIFVSKVNNISVRRSLPLFYGVRKTAHELTPSKWCSR